MGTEANWLSLCSRTHFSDRLLLSMNSLQSLGSYYGTPSLSRSCPISAQYTKSFTIEKKRRYSWCLLSERRFFSFNSSAESFDKLRSRTRSFNSFWENGCGALSSRTPSSSSSSPSTLEVSSSLMSGSSPKIGTGISSQWATNFWKISRFYDFKHFDITTQNYRTWILFVIKIIISNQNNYSSWHFTPTNF